jgi:hypothetical protein
MPQCACRRVVPGAAHLPSRWQVVTWQCIYLQFHLSIHTQQACGVRPDVQPPSQHLYIANLFFRSAGAEVPVPQQGLPTDDLGQLSLLEREHHDRCEVESCHSDTDSAAVKIDAQKTVLRKASRRFPSKSLKLRLPQF